VEYINKYYKSIDQDYIRLVSSTNYVEKKLKPQEKEEIEKIKKIIEESLKQLFSGLSDFF